MKRTLLQSKQWSSSTAAQGQGWCIWRAERCTGKSKSSAQRRRLKQRKASSRTKIRRKLFVSSSSLILTLHCRQNHCFLFLWLHLKNNVSVYKSPVGVSSLVAKKTGYLIISAAVTPKTSWGSLSSHRLRSSHSSVNWSCCRNRRELWSLGKQLLIILYLKLLKSSKSWSRSLAQSWREINTGILSTIMTFMKAYDWRSRTNGAMVWWSCSQMFSAKSCQNMKTRGNNSRRWRS